MALEKQVEALIGRLYRDDDKHVLVRVIGLIADARDVIEIADRGLGVSLPKRFARALDDLGRSLVD